MAIFVVLNTMRKIYSLLFFINLLSGLSAQGPCQLKLEEVYLDTAASDCNHLFFKYKVSGGTVSNYYWNYGDGNSCTCLHPKHTYTQNGTFQLCGRIEDANGCKDSMCISVTVNCANPCDLSEIGIYSADTLSYSCNEYEFNSIVSKNTKVLNWDFGDGNSSGDAFTTHKYSKNGSYNVRLIIKDSIDCADTADWLVQVNCKDVPCDMRILTIDTSTGPDCHNKRFSITTSKPAKSIWWQYGDGNSGFGNATEIHYYADSGNYEVCVYAYDSFNCVDTACFNLLVNCPGKNSDIDQIESYKWVYSSIFNETITFESTVEASYQLIDINGRVLKKGLVTLGKNLISTDEFVKGVYTLVIENQVHTERGRLMKF